MSYNMYSPCDPCCDCTPNCVMSGCMCQDLPSVLSVGQDNPIPFSNGTPYFPPCWVGRSVIPEALKKYDLPTVGYYSPQIFTPIYSGIIYNVNCESGDYKLYAYVADSGNVFYPTGIYLQSWTPSSGESGVNRCATKPSSGINASSPTLYFTSGNKTDDIYGFSLAEAIERSTIPSGYQFYPWYQSTCIAPFTKPCCGCVLPITLTDCYGHVLPNGPLDPHQFYIDFTSTSGVIEGSGYFDGTVPYSTFRLHDKNEIRIRIYNTVSGIQTYTSGTYSGSGVPSGSILLYSGVIPSGYCTYRSPYGIFVSDSSGTRNNINNIVTNSGTFSCCANMGDHCLVDKGKKYKLSFYDPAAEWISNNLASLHTDTGNDLGISPETLYDNPYTSNGNIPGANNKAPGAQDFPPFSCHDADWYTQGILDDVIGVIEKIDINITEMNFRDNFTFTFNKDKNWWETECKLYYSYTRDYKIYDPISWLLSETVFEDTPCYPPLDYNYVTEWFPDYELHDTIELYHQFVMTCDPHAIINPNLGVYIPPHAFIQEFRRGKSVTTGTSYSTEFDYSSCSYVTTSEGYSSVYDEEDCATRLPFGTDNLYSLNLSSGVFHSCHPLVQSYFSQGTLKWMNSLQAIWTCSNDPDNPDTYDQIINSPQMPDNIASQSGVLTIHE